MPYTIILNESQDEFVLRTPAGDEFGPMDAPDEGIAIVNLETGPVLAVLPYCEGDGLVAGTVYTLSPVPTECAEVNEFEDDDEDDGEDDEITVKPEED
jgi:hypothetical protein